MKNKSISLKIINTPKFLKMPIEAQALYFHLIINADNDGFVEGYIVSKFTDICFETFTILEHRKFIRVLSDDYYCKIYDWCEHWGD